MESLKPSLKSRWFTTVRCSYSALEGAQPPHNHSRSLHQREVLKRSKENSDHTANCTPRASPNENKRFQPWCQKKQFSFTSFSATSAGGFGKQKRMVSFPPPLFTHTETWLPLLLPRSAEQIHHDPALQSNSSGCWTECSYLVGLSAFLSCLRLQWTKSRVHPESPHTSRPGWRITVMSM